MKRILSLAMVLALFMCMVLPASAAVKDEAELQYTYVKSLSANLSISSGTAECYGYVSAYSSLPVTLRVRLQKYEDGSWTTLQTWTSSGTTAATLTKYYAVASGYSYRVYVSGSVYNSDGLLLEVASTSYSV